MKREAPAKYAINSLLVVGVGAAFQWFFMFTKHDPGLRPIIPFGDDPYDALGSFATIVNLPLFALLLWRTCRIYMSHGESSPRTAYLLRTQAAIVLSILVTLAADAVAMARHSGMWIGEAAQNNLLVIFAVMILLSTSVLWLVQSSAPKQLAPQRNAATLPTVIAVLFLLTLAIYPERLINHLSTHIVTVLMGDLLLFLPVSVFLRFLFSDSEDTRAARQTSRGASLYIWTGAILASLGLGVYLFFAEMTEGGSAMPPIRQRLIVASVYIGLTLGGILIALALLRRPLGLGLSKAAHPNPS